VAICEKCGLPDDLCVCEELVKESQRVKITTDKRRFGKVATVIQGIDDRSIDLKELSSLLKAKCACGGTIKQSVIELQGDHKEKVKELLLSIGYSPDFIDVKK
jgi:translation initiation factor 1